MANTIALNAVYDHILNTAVPKDVRQPELHKKSELRGIYNSIVKVNKDSPLYLLKDDEPGEENAIALKEQARALRSTIYQLSNIEEEDILDQKSAYSTNEDAVSATLVKSAADEDDLPAFAINVKQLATTQINTGKFLPSGAVQLEPGQYSFNVRISEQKYEFQYSINKDDLNREVQERLSRLVDKAGVGLHAEVISDSKGYTALEISAGDTGTSPNRDYRFHITEDEISTNGGTVEYFGLDHVTSTANNAIFDINDKERVSASNHFMVASTYELTLHDTTPDGAVEIGVHNDTESLLDHLHKLAEGYNDFLDNIGSYDKTHFKSGKIESETRQVAMQHLGDLSEIGIRLAENGHIELDDEKLSAAAREEGGIEHFQPVNDFAKALIDKSKEISLDPMKYVERPVVNYKNPGHGFISPYITSEYSGMIFSGYC